MEIKKPTLEIEDKLEQLKVRILELHQDLSQEPSIKERDIALKELTISQEHQLINLQPLTLFNDLEQEYNKVKDFNFSKLEVKDISKNIKTL